MSSHLLSEVIRRFFLYSNLIYYTADAVLICVAIFVSRLGVFNIDSRILLLFYLYVLIGMMSLLVYQEHPGLILVGVRPILMGFCSYVIGYNIYRYCANAEALASTVFGVWLVIIITIAVIQIDAGVSSPINQLPDDAGVEFGGRGDYSSKVGSLDWLFRPTSIFMHTGRLGQYSFFLGLFFCLPVALKKSSAGEILLALVSICLIFVSGQRAALVFLCLSVLLAFIFSGTIKVVLKVLLLLFALWVVALVISSDLRDVVASRFISGFDEGLARIDEQGGVWYIGFSRYVFLGQGLGFFSFGSQAFGGDTYYDYMSQFGGGGAGENAWLAIEGETGLFGLLLYIMALAHIIKTSYKRVLRAAQVKDRVVHMAPMLFTLSMCGWGFTHVVFGNYLQMIALFFLFGASTGRAYYSQAQVDYTLRPEQVALSPNLAVMKGKIGLSNRWD